MRETAAPDAASHPDHSRLEVAKWVAIAAMGLDHAGKIVAPEVLSETHVLGRLALPLFAWIVAMRLSLDARLTARYLRALVPWALVSQPAYVLAGREWSEGNILFTLSLGVAADLALRAWASGSRVAGGSLLLLVAVGAPFVEFGVPGVALVPVLARLCAGAPLRAAWLVGPLGVLANASWPPPILTVSALGAGLASFVAVTSLRAERRLPRLPKHAFYAFYPAHLLVLHAIDTYS